MVSLAPMKWWVCITFLCMSTSSRVDAFLQPKLNADITRSLDTKLYLKKGGTKKKAAKGNTITVNKLAYRNYEVLETLEVGISLKGTEVKRYANCL